MAWTRVFTLAVLLGACLSLPQQTFDYDYLYEDFVGTPDFQQPVPQAPIVESRPRSRAEAAPPPVRTPAGRPPARPSATPNRLDDAETTTYVPILRDNRRTDPLTGAFIYDYMGADGAGKYEIRFLNGTVIGNYTYINDIGERETRWYSAGTKVGQDAGDGTLVDETTGANYVDLGNYELYRHLEVPYVHLAGPSDPDESGQLSRPRTNQDVRASQSQPRSQSRPRVQQAPVQQQPPQPSQVPIDHGDDARFFQQTAQEQPQHFSEPARRAQAPVRVSRTRVRVAAEPSPVQPRQRVAFDPSAVNPTSPNHVLDSLISQFQK